MAEMPLTKPAETRHLTGHLGPIAIIFMIVAAAAPLTTVSATVPVAMLVGNGAGFPAMYIVAAVILAFFAVGFMAMTPYVPRAGAFYSYITQGLGRGPGIAAAFLALLTYTTVQVGVHAFMGVVLHDFVLSLGGPDIVWWLYTALSVAVVGALGYRNIDVSSKVLGVVLLGEVAICLIFDIAVIVRGGGPEGLSTAAFRPSEILSGSPSLGLMFAISGFLGFEAAAVFRDEARDPKRTIPRATYGALVLIGGFYALTSWAMVSAWGDEGAVDRAQTSSATMLLDAGGVFLGQGGRDVMQYLLIGSVFACVLSFHNVIARYIFSLANTGVLPAAAGRSHPRHDSPYVASLVQTASASIVLIVCVAFGLDPIAQIFTWLVGVATVGVLLLMFATCVAILVFFRGNKDDSRPWNTLIAPALGCVGLGLATLITIWNLPLLVGSKSIAVVVGVALAATIAAGFAVARARPDANVINA